MHFYGYGLGPEVTDCTIYGFGQQAYKDILSAAADTSETRGIQLDIQLGPQQGSGPPAEPQTEGLARQLGPLPWKLAGESHVPGSIDSVESAVETINVGTLQKLVPWTQIPQLAQVSSMGTYETSFDFAAGAVGEGGTPPHLQTASRCASASGPSATRSARGECQLPPLDLTDAVANVTDYLGILSRAGTACGLR